MLNSKATVCSLKVLQKCIFWKQNLPFCSQSRVLGFEACHVKIKPLYHHEMTWSQRTHGRREITFKTFTPGACLPVQAQLAALTVSALLKGIMTVVMKRRGTALMRVNSYQRSTVTEKKQEGGVAAAASRWVCVRVCVCGRVCIVYSLHSSTLAEHQNHVAFCYEVNTTPNPEAGPGQTAEPRGAVHHLWYPDDAPDLQGEDF